MKAKSKKAWVGACHVIAVPAWRRSAGLAGPLFGPTPEHELFRVMFKEPDEAGTWAWTSRTGQTETEAWEKFAQIVEAFEAHTAVPVRQREQRDRTIEALFELYIADSKERGKAVRTVEGRESKGRAHIIPTIGDLPVAQWRLEHTREGGCPGASTRSTDWSSPGCPASTFPSTDGRRGGLGHEARHPRHRDVQRLPYPGLQIRVAGYWDARSGEPLGFRAIDPHFETGWVNINGSWTQPREQDSPAFRGR